MRNRFSPQIQYEVLEDAKPPLLVHYVTSILPENDIESQYKTDLVSNQLPTSLHPNKPAIGHQQAGQLLFHRRGVLLLLLLKGARQLLSFASAPRERGSWQEKFRGGCKFRWCLQTTVRYRANTLAYTHTHKILTWHPPPVVFSPRCVCLKTMLQRIIAFSTSENCFQVMWLLLDQLLSLEEETPL